MLQKVIGSLHRLQGQVPFFEHILNKTIYNSSWESILNHDFKGCRMGRSVKVSLWYVALLINTRFRFFILE